MPKKNTQRHPFAPYFDTKKTSTFRRFRFSYFVYTEKAKYFHMLYYPWDVIIQNKNSKGNWPLNIYELFRNNAICMCHKPFCGHLSIHFSTPTKAVKYSSISPIFMAIFSGSFLVLYYLVYNTALQFVLDAIGEVG